LVADCFSAEESMQAAEGPSRLCGANVRGGRGGIAKLQGRGGVCVDASSGIVNSGATASPHFHDSLVLDAVTRVTGLTAFTSSQPHSTLHIDD
jgi:hypothetical protein